MDEQAKFKKMLDEVRHLLPSSVISTCESLNGHGEWEIALSHCQYHLQAINAQLSENAKKLIEDCKARFNHSSG